MALQLSPSSRGRALTLLDSFCGCRLGSGADPNDRYNQVLVSRRQQFVVPAITYQRRIVQSGSGDNTVAVSCLHDCFVRVASVSIKSRRRHLFIPLKNLRPEFASNAVDPGLRVGANRVVRPDPLVRNDLVRVIPTAHLSSSFSFYCRRS